MDRVWIGYQGRYWEKWSEDTHGGGFWWVRLDRGGYPYDDSPPWGWGVPWGVPGGAKGEFSMNGKEVMAIRQELKQFYADLAMGKWKGHEQEAEVEEVRLLKAAGIQVKEA